MKQVEHRRRVPAAKTALVIIVALAVLQGAVIAGMLDISSLWIKKLVPWAYEPFLYMVGEHPSMLVKADKAPEKEVPSSGLTTVAGFAPEDLEIKLDLQGEVDTNLVIDPILPAGENEEPADLEDDTPVG